MAEYRLPLWAAAWIERTGGTLDDNDTELLHVIDKAGPGFASTNARIEDARVEGPADAPELALLFSHPDRPGLRLGYRWPLGKGGDYGLDILLADYMEMADRANDDRLMEAQQGPDGIAWINGPDEDIDYWEEHPDPSDEDIEEVCRAWVRYQHRTAEDTEVHDDDPDYWAVEAVLGVTDRQPELLWKVIRVLCSVVDPTDVSTVAMIGVAPIEDLLRREGARTMDLIEPAADSDPVLLRALASVWISEPTRSRLDRYLTARGSGYGTGPV